MSDPKEFNEANERDLEQVSGGVSNGITFLYRCPVCGNETTVYAGSLRRNPMCSCCAITAGKYVTMELV